MNNLLIFYKYVLYNCFCLVNLYNFFVITFVVSSFCYSFIQLFPAAYTFINLENIVLLIVYYIESNCNSTNFYRKSINNY